MLVPHNPHLGPRPSEVMPNDRDTGLDGMRDLSAPPGGLHVRRCRLSAPTKKRIFMIAITSRVQSMVLFYVKGWHDQKEGP